MRLARAAGPRRFAKVTRREEREANRRARRRLANAVGRDFAQATDAFRGLSVARLGGGPREIRPFTFEIPMANFSGRLRLALQRRLEEAVDTGARLGLRFRPARFPRLPADTVTELAAGFADRQAATAVRGITAETRRGIQRVILDSLADQLSPTETFERVGQLAGLGRRQAGALERFRAQLERQLVPAEVTARGRVVRTPQIQALIDRRVAAYRDRLLRARGRLIGETEVQTAIQRGERAYYEAAAAEGDVELGEVEKTWYTVQDERVCPICEPLHGSAIPFEELFDTDEGAIEGPPAHPACRCFLQFTGGGASALLEDEGEA
jgi:hypothetical protein